MTKTQISIDFGNWRMNYYQKIVADDLYKVAVWTLVRDARKYNFAPIRITWSDSTFIICHVLLSPDWSSVRFSYDDKEVATGEPRHFEYNIQLQTASCYLGGRRHWFMCAFERDGKFCGRRVGVLYKCGNYFACRHCFNLTYRSRNDNRRNAFYPALHFLDVGERTKELENRIQNRRTYAGKLTKKAIRLVRLYTQLHGAAKEVTPIENYEQK